MKKKVKFPAKIGLTKCLIDTEVVKVDILLLLSKTSLKKAGTILDMEKDSAVMFKQSIPLEFTSSEHYCVDIKEKDTEKDQTEEEVLTVTENMSPDEKCKVLLKLHKQFDHASADRLQRLMQSSGNKDKECFAILQQIVDDCEICQKYKRTKLKPAVGLPMVSEYNETVAVDLHELELSVWYLHIIDHFTRFSAGSIVKTKKSSETPSFTLGLVFMALPKNCTVIMEGNSTTKRSETWLKTLTLRQEQQLDTVHGAMNYSRNLTKHHPRSS